ncbi:SpoIIE family protein phosphatase [Cellulomonas sp.]|uniref:SpoIIE family protein phosphatase n=1 Tax=Cellulomonas sp. TaxID=40001 RepID=UPI001B2C54FE|nr:SpoIIE family protein phosphatase [Cellulomonas sp.]MBO9556504.1 SpoIIE family protein phosphatase [Cellulomonas sp.]
MTGPVDLGALDAGVCVTDPRLPDDPVVWVNDAFTRITGYRLEHVVGRNCRFLQGPETDPVAVAEIRAALDEGRVVSTVLRNHRRDGSAFWNQLVIGSVHDDTGAVTHRVSVMVDVSDRLDPMRDVRTELSLQAGTRLELLARVSDELARHLDYEAAVDTLGDLVIPALATWGFVAVTDDRGRFEHVHVVAGDAASGALAQSLAEQDLGWLRRAPKVTAALATHPGYVALPYEIDTTGLPGRTSPEQLALLEALGLGSALVVPLRARDRVIGVLCLVHEKPDGFTPDAVVTAAHLSRRAGLALDNVRLFLAQRAAALTLQHSLLPEIPDVPGLDVAALYVPSARLAAVGGDWFDVLPLPDGSIGLAVGDVVGHDMAAAAAMGQLRSLLRSFAWDGDRPTRVLARTDELVRGLDVADIATCVYARVQPDGARLEYARAGHPPPLLRLPDGTVTRLDGALGTPIGIGAAGRPVVEQVVDLPRGATLVMYTDGLIERRDRGLRDGIEALVEAVAALPAELDATQVRDRLVGELVGEHQEDDVCLLVVRRR